MVSDSGKVMVTPSFGFSYHCAGVQHNQWIIYYPLVMLHTCTVICKSKGGCDHDLAMIRDR